MPRKKTARKTAPKEKDVPAKVGAQEDKANEMIAKLAAGEDPNADPNASNADPEPNTADPGPPKPTHPDPGSTLDPDPKKTEPKKTEPVKKDEPRVDPGDYQPPSNEDVATLTQRLSTLEGKYNTEITRLNTALQTSQNIIESQEALIKRLQAGEQNAGDGDTAPASTIKKLNPDDFSSYGSEMESLAGLVNTLIDENARLKKGQAVSGTGTQGESDRLAKVEEKMNNLGQTVHMSAKQTYYQALDNGIRNEAGQPDWEAINRDPKFASWLQSEEPMTGIARKAILLKANQDMNAERVIAIFSEYKRSQNAMPTNSDQTNLSDQVTPDTAATSDGGDGDPNAGKEGLVTTEMLKKAKNDFVQGRIDEAAFDKIAENYQRSIAKGWIQPGQ